jgi:hypothetical protein
MNVTVRRISSCVALLASLSLPPARAKQRVRDREADTAPQCEIEAQKRLGIQAFRVSADRKAPKRTRYVAPSYPATPQGTPSVVGQGWWVGDVLIGRNGKVVDVFVRREPKFTPPFPAFAAAIVRAIREWEYERSDTPVCMTVTITIDWS